MWSIEALRSREPRRPIALPSAAVALGESATMLCNKYKSHLLPLFGNEVFLSLLSAASFSRTALVISRAEGAATLTFETAFSTSDLLPEDIDTERLLCLLLLPDLLRR